MSFLSPKWDILAIVVYINQFLIVYTECTQNGIVFASVLLYMGFLNTYMLIMVKISYCQNKMFSRVYCFKFHVHGWLCVVDKGKGQFLNVIFIVFQHYKTNVNKYFFILSIFFLYHNPVYKQ